MFSIAYRFVAANTKRATVINEDGTRNDRDEYPLTAVRELLLNALIHRDYSYLARSIPISLTIYDNRIEISNPGSILGNYKVEDLGKEYLPIRNAFLCRNAEDLLETENRHSGILTVIEDMKKNELFPPLFDCDRGFFHVTLYNRSAQDYKNKQFVDEVLQFCFVPRSKASIAAHFGFGENNATYFYNTYLRPLIRDELLFLTMPDAPSSKFQRISSNKKEVN